MAVPLANLVRVRARGRCEYCHLPESVTRLRHMIDHVIARKHHGPTIPENLALACGSCNGAKGPNIAGLDPADNALTRLFNPRTDLWSDHFICGGSGVIEGMTAVGRATADVLAFNLPTRVAARAELRGLGHSFD